MIRFYSTQVQYSAHLAPIQRALRARTSTCLWNEAIPLPDDGCPVVIAGQSDLGMIPGACPVALVSHGVDQTYRDVDHGAYAGGRNRERISLFLCPSQRAADANLAHYPDAQTVVVGSPRVEALRSPSAYGPSPVGAGTPPSPSPVPTVAFAWHWNLGICPETRTAWPHYQPVVERLAALGEYRLIGHGHPRDAERLEAAYSRIGIEWEPDFARVLAQAQLVVFDNTSAGYEAAACGLPVLAVDAPWYRAEVDHGVRFWSHVPGLRLMAHRAQRPEMGVVHAQWGRDVLPDAIGEALDDRAELATARQAAVGEVYETINGAADMAAESLLAWAQPANMVDIPRDRAT